MKTQSTTCLRDVLLVALLALPVGAGASPQGASGSAGQPRAQANAALAAAESGLVAADSIPPAPLVVDTVSAPLEAGPVVPPAEPVPIFLGKQEVFVVRKGVAGLSPLQRAAVIRARVDVAVRDRSLPPDSLRLTLTQDGLRVELGPRLLWVVTPTDAQVADVSQLRSLVPQLSVAVREGIEQERASRRPLRLLISVLIALGILLVSLVLARLLLLAGRRWRAWLERRIGDHVHGVQVRDFEVVSSRQLIQFLQNSVGRIDLVCLVLLAYICSTAMLWQFPGTQGWSGILSQFALGWLSRAGWAVLRALPNLLSIALIILVARWVARVFDRFFESIESGRVHVSAIHPDLARPTRRLVGILVWIFAAIMIYPLIPGGHSAAVTGISAVIGLMLSLGSSNLVGNIIAGFVLTYSRSFRPGELVRLGEHMGNVVSLGVLSTKIRTLRNEELTLANSLILGAPILNFSRLVTEGGLILHTQVTIGYDAEWRKVHSLLIEAAKRVRGVDDTPEPWVLQRSLNDSHITYELCAVTQLAGEQLHLYSDLHAEIQDAFARAGVEILSPAYHAMRDANAPVLPDEPAGPRPEPGGFRLRK